jgi:hypothetical protein
MSIDVTGRSFIASSFLINYPYVFLRLPLAQSYLCIVDFAKGIIAKMLG